MSVNIAENLLFLPHFVTFLGPAFGCGVTTHGSKLVPGLLFTGDPQSLIRVAILAFESDPKLLGVIKFGPHTGGAVKIKIVFYNKHISFETKNKFYKITI